jgi:hypothetical protein
VLLLLVAVSFDAYLPTTVVWNIKSQEKRLVELTPNDDWGGAGLLGVTIRIDNYGGADERLIRVLDVEQPDSPASVAGLVPMKDYLLGTTVTGFESAPVLASVLQRYIDHVVEIYVYNSDSDVVRVVPLMPTYNWGVGRGLLGAEVGTGYLHRLPNSCRSTIGHSVERKVRWMNKGGTKDATSTTNSTDANATTATTTTGEDHPQPTDQTLLEMEPHMEMEVEKDANNQHLNPEDVIKQPHQLGKAVMSPARYNGTQQQTQTHAQQPAASQAASAAAETTAESSQPQQQRAASAVAPAAEPTSEVQSQAPIQLVAPPILSSEAVADLFSKPPPNSSEPTEQQPPPAVVSNVPNVAFIPPPPKMHY